MRGIALLLAGILAAPAAALAQMPQPPMGGGPMGGPMGGPPPAAFSACEGRAQGSACRFDAPFGVISGTCRVMRDPRPVCVPGHPPGQVPGQVPGQMGNAPGGPPVGGAMGGGPTDSGPRGPAGGQRPMGADIASDNPTAIAVANRVPDTNQGSCFDADGVIPCPAPGAPYSGQDANYRGATPAYRDNGDGTVGDLVTGLLWQKAHNAKRLDYYGAESACRSLRLGGFTDWRLPTIKELFSLADFRGSQGRRPFLSDVFEFHEPGAEVLEGDRFASTHNTGMMGQTWSSTIYTGVHFGRPGVEAAFFFNFLDGHIKQAPTRGRSALFYRCVHGQEWGGNRFTDRHDGTVTDEATGLTWQKSDDGETRDWPHALAYCESLKLAGHDDWRLPNVKELEIIVDYRRHAPALDQRYLTMTDPKGWFWSGTTHGDNIRMASYVCFGPCTDVNGLDVHGAGAQRSDPKVGDPSAYNGRGGLGGQRDEVRIRNYARCVR